MPGRIRRAQHQRGVVKPETAMLLDAPLVLDVGQLDKTTAIWPLAGGTRTPEGNRGSQNCTSCEVTRHNLLARSRDLTGVTVVGLAVFCKDLVKYGMA